MINHSKSGTTQCFNDTIEPIQYKKVFSNKIECILVLIIKYFIFGTFLIFFSFLSPKINADENVRFEKHIVIILILLFYSNSDNINSLLFIFATKKQNFTVKCI